MAMRVSEAHQLKDGSQVTAADPQFGKTVKDMPRYEYLALVLKSESITKGQRPSIKGARTNPAEGQREIRNLTGRVNRFKEQL